MAEWWKVAGALVIASVMTGSNAQCQHGYNAPSWRVAEYERPHWRILPAWGDSHFHGLSSIFDDDWFDSFHKPIFRYLDDGSMYRSNRNNLEQQHEPEYKPNFNQEQPTQSHNRCQAARQERQLQHERQLQREAERQELERLEAARRQAQLERLEKAERSLVEEKQRRAEQYRREQEAFKQKQEEIQRLRAELGDLAGLQAEDKSASTPGQTEGQPRVQRLSSRAEELEEMKTRQQRLAEEQRRISQIKQQQKEAELERQRKQAELEHKRMEERERARKQAQREEELRLQEKLRAEEGRRRAEEQEAARLQREQQEYERMRQDMRREEERRKQAEQRHQANQNVLASHYVTGYDPDDITVTIADGRIKMEGKHICTCTENCVTREFVRGYQLPADIEPASLTATLDTTGNILIKGAVTRNPTQSNTGIKVKVQGLGIPQSTRPSADELRRCLGEKGGIKLHKINKGTGKPHVEEKFKYDHEIFSTPEVNRSNDLYKGDNDPFDFDDSYVEVEDYY